MAVGDTHLSSVALGEELDHVSLLLFRESTEKSLQDCIIAGWNLCWCRLSLPLEWRGCGAISIADVGVLSSIGLGLDLWCSLSLDLGQVLLDKQSVLVAKWWRQRLVDLLNFEVLKNV